MINVKLPTVFLLILLLTISICKAQDCTSDVHIEVVKATSHALGKVIFKLINGDSRDIDDSYFIFNITAEENVENKDRRDVKNGEVQLPKGTYEFLIVDRKKEHCHKEFIVKIEEQ